MRQGYFETVSERTNGFNNEHPFATLPELRKIKVNQVLREVEHPRLD